MADYRININPDADFSVAEVERFNISALAVGGLEAKTTGIWFKTITVVIAGANQRVFIDANENFAAGELKKLQATAKVTAGAAQAGSHAWWFLTVLSLTGRRVIIAPDLSFGEKEIIAMLAGGQTFGGVELSDFSWWFETALLPLLVDIQPGWPDVAIISKAVGYDTATIRWLSSHDGNYQVEVGGSGKGTGIILDTVFGSQNVQGTVLAGTPVDSIIKAADLEAASAGDGEKRINIYVTDGYGRTNPWEG